MFFASPCAPRRCRNYSGAGRRGKSQNTLIIIPTLGLLSIHLAVNASMHEVILIDLPLNNVVGQEEFWVPLRHNNEKVKVASAKGL